VRGLFIMGEDIVLSEPNVSCLEEGLNKIDFLVLQDIFLSETARYADVVLPATCFAEKDGVFTNSERRVQRVRKAVEPPGEARADVDILIDLANRCGAAWKYDGAAAVWDELAGCAARFAGMSHARIDRDGGLQWPCPSPDHPGTRFLHEGGALRGKGLFQPVEYRPSVEQPDDEYPLVLSTGRTLYHYNAATQTTREEGLMAKQPGAFVEIHPADARRRGIADGDWVALRTRRGEVRCPAIISRQVRPGCIWMPFHFAGARANLLTVDAGDTVTGTAEYKVCAAQVERASAPHGEAPFPGAYFRADLEPVNR
jgi:formate dehydrogenase major subunit/formate dehydrogenase alpha subunit